MEPASPASLVESLLHGELDLAKAAGLTPDDLQAIAQLGASALVANRAEAAARIFGALEALEPFEPMHCLHRAWAEAAAGHRAEAVSACDRFLERGEAKASKADLVRALLLRASQRPPEDQRLADSDRAAAQFLAARDEEARAVFEGRVR